MSCLLSFNLPATNPLLFQLDIHYNTYLPRDKNTSPSSSSTSPAMYPLNLESTNLPFYQTVFGNPLPRSQPTSTAFPCTKFPSNPATTTPPARYKTIFGPFPPHTPTLPHLPPEILDNIVSRLPLHTLIQLARTTRTLGACIEPLIWLHEYLITHAVFCAPKVEYTPLWVLRWRAYGGREGPGEEYSKPWYGRWQSYGGERRWSEDALKKIVEKRRVLVWGNYKGFYGLK